MAGISGVHGKKSPLAVGAKFDARQLGAQKIHYDFSNTTGLALSGVSVTSATDRSAATIVGTPSGASAYPTLVSNGLYFDGSDGFSLDADGKAVIKNLTSYNGYFVFDPYTFAANQIIYFTSCGGIGEEARTRFSIEVLTSGNLRFSVRHTDADASASLTTLSTETGLVTNILKLNQTYIVTWDVDVVNAKLNVWIDGYPHIVNAAFGTAAAASSNSDSKTAYIGKTHSGGFFTGILREFVIRGGLWTDNARKRAEIGLSEKYNVKVLPNLRILTGHRGDSISAGTSSGFGAQQFVNVKNYPGKLRSKIGNSKYVQFRNGAVAGDLIADQRANTAVNAYLASDEYTHSICILMCGTNDLGTATTAAAAWAEMQTFIDETFAAGWQKIILGTVTKRFDSASYNTKVDQYNDLIQAGYAAKGVSLVDWSEHADAIGTIGKNAASAANGYFYDNIHPNEAGYEVMANVLLPVYLSALAA